MGNFLLKIARTLFHPDNITCVCGMIIRPGTKVVEPDGLPCRTNQHTTLALTARYIISEVRNKPYTFICIDCSRAIYHCSIKPEVRNTEVRYNEFLLYLYVFALICERGLIARPIRYNRKFDILKFVILKIVILKFDIPKFCCR